LLYVNGVLDNAYDIGNRTIDVNKHSLVVGLKDQTSNPDCLYGIKNLKIYNIKLHAGAIEAASSKYFYLYQGTFGLKPTDIRVGC
jgi:hypothetical protein